MIHVAWIGKKSPFCGNVSYGNLTTEQLKLKGHKVSFIHFNNSSTANKSQSFLTNTSEISLPYLIKSQIYTIPSPRAEKELRISLERLKPDIVHVSLTLSPLDFRLPELCKQINLPLVGTFHPAFDIQNRNLIANTQHLAYQIYAPTLAKFHKIIVFSELQKTLLEKLGVSKEKQIIIPNGVDENIWQPLSERSKKYNLVKSKLGEGRIFIYMGRIANEKNIAVLLKSWRQTKTNNCKLVIVGDGPMKATLEKSFSNIGTDKLIWWGSEMDLENRVALMQIAEVFFLPSLVEGLSLSLLEAMSTGNACIATDAGADGEVLDNGAGIVMSTQNIANQLKIIIPILVDHPTFTKALGEKGRARIIERYTVKKNITALEKLYLDSIKEFNT